jgi:hypothetical protein
MPSSSHAATAGRPAVTPAARRIPTGPAIALVVAALGLGGILIATGDDGSAGASGAAAASTAEHQPAVHRDGRIAPVRVGGVQER